MKLIFLRHAIATKKHDSDTIMDDFRRRLEPVGVLETKEMIHSCFFLFKKIDTVFTSPLCRAVQTAQILHRHIPHADFEIMSSLDPLSSLQDFQDDLKKLPSDGTYCFVGHEPHLSTSVSLLLGANESVVELAKSGVAILEGEDVSSLKISTLLAPKLVMKI